MSKVLLIIAAVLGLAAAGLGFLNKQRADELRQQLTASQEAESKAKAELSAKERQLGEAEEKRKAAEQEKEDLSRSLAAAKKEAQNLSSQIAAVRSEIAQKDQKINDLTSVIEQMKLAQASAQSGTETAQGASAELETLKTEKAELEQLNKSLTAKLEQTESQLRALAEAERARQAGIMRKSLQGRVLAVNSAWGFVVINLGDRQNIVQGAEMIVHREGQRVGKIRVSSVERTQSVADIIPDSVTPGLMVMPGDLVILAGS